MKCPACPRNLTEIEVDSVKLDVCQGGCGGIWFDNFELKKFDEPHEEAGDLLQIERDPSIVVDHEARRNCPKCPDIVMMRHFFSVKKEVEVDHCAGCAGYWLDAGELHQIREQYIDEKDRDQDAKAHFNEVFGEMFEDMKRDTEEDLAKAQRVQSLLRFITPSRWLR